MNIGKYLFIHSSSFVDSQLSLVNLPLVAILGFQFLMTQWNLCTLSRNAFIFHEISDLTRYLENHMAVRYQYGFKQTSSFNS